LDKTPICPEKEQNDPHSYDIRVLSEEDVTLSMLHKYKRFDADYRSIDDNPVQKTGAKIINVTFSALFYFISSRELHCRLLISTHL
jgi:hypothetical protein